MKIPIDIVKIAPIITFIYKWWAKTLRFKVHGEWKSIFERNKAGERFTVALWHDEIFPLIAFANSTSKNFVGIASQSKDGEIIAQVLEGLGQMAVRGSSSRGGVKALLQVKRIIDKENRIAVFAADGPRGPRHKAKDGVLFLSQRAKAKIITARVHCHQSKVFNSWDRFILPLPFSRCDIYVGDLFEVTTEELTKEVMASEKKRLEKDLSDLGAGFKG